MAKLKDLLCNRQGAMHLRTCICVMILCALFVLMFNYTATIVVARAQRKGAMQTLDKYTQLNAIAIHESIKEQHNTTGSLDTDVFIEALSLAQNLTLNEEGLYVAPTADGDVLYKVSGISLGFTEELTTKIYASYTLTVPLHFSGTTTWIQIPVTIYSKLDAKF